MGRITRVDPKTGATTTFASGLPRTIPAVGLGGAIDVAFLGRTAYVLVTMVGPDLGGQDVVGIYRVDGPNRVTVVADIGQFALDNPPETASSSRAESSTRCSPIAVGSWSPMGTTTACIGSRSMAGAASSSRSATSFPPG